MGLFGKSLEDQVKEAITQINSKGMGVTGLDARIEGKTVTLTGEARDAAAKTKVMEEFNALVTTENTMNMIKVKQAPAAPAAPAATAASVSATVPMGTTTASMGPAAPQMKTTLHEVMAGETLSAIAKKYYGKSNLYTKIFDANTDQLQDPDKIKVGQKLRIPELGPDHIA